MAVPAHDERDYEFASTFNLPMKEVVKGGDITKEAYTGDGAHVNSAFLDGLNKEEAIAKMIEWLEVTSAGNQKVTYRLRDCYSAVNVTGVSQFQLFTGKMAQ